MYAYPSLITVLALILYLLVTYNVGRARAKYRVPPPSTISSEEGFNRVYRVQQNTLEQLILFLPSLWLFAMYVSEIWAGTLGALWLAGRVLYARGYYRHAPERYPGFFLSLFASGALLMGSLTGILRVMLGL